MVDTLTISGLDQHEQHIIFLFFCKCFKLVKLDLESWLELIFYAVNAVRYMTEWHVNWTFTYMSSNVCKCLIYMWLNLKTYVEKFELCLNFMVEFVNNPCTINTCVCVYHKRYASYLYASSNKNVMLCVYCTRFLAVFPSQIYSGRISRMVGPLVDAVI